MTCCDISYIAGMLDADGFIAIVPRNGGRTHGAMVGIVNRDVAVLRWIQSLFGGKIEPRDYNRKAPHARNWAQVYDIRFRAEEMGVFLKTVAPYLHIKREQAELALELMSTRQDRRKEYRLKPEVRQRRTEIYQRCRELNHPAPMAVQ